jgi:tripartite-type tricarboxylate transporter receptor subunit TctC
MIYTKKELIRRLRLRTARSSELTICRPKERNPMKVKVSRALVALSLLFSISQAAFAQYPTRAVRMIVPFGAGGPTDLVSRVLSTGLSEAWGKPVIVENRTGAGGNIGGEAAARSAPDGYTLLLVPSGFLVINPWLFEKMPFDPQKDFTPISLLGSGPIIMFVSPKLPVKTLAEFIQYAKSNPGRLNYSSAGIGTIPHLAGEMLQQQTGIKMVHVPYPGAPQSISAVMNGDADVMFDSPTSITHMKSGKIRGIAVLAKKRYSGAPELPSTAEAGLPAFTVDAWYALLAPANTPADLIRKIQADTAKVLHSADAKAKLDSIGFESVVSAPDALAKQISSEGAQWGVVFKAAGIRPQ